MSLEGTGTPDAERPSAPRRARRTRLHVSRRMGAATAARGSVAAARGHFVPRPLSGVHRQHLSRSFARSRASSRCTSTYPTSTTRTIVRERVWQCGACRPDASAFITSPPTSAGPAITARLRADAAARPTRSGDRRLGLQRVGWQVSAVRRRRRGADASRGGARSCPSSTPASSWKAAQLISMAPARS